MTFHRDIIYLSQIMLYDNHGREINYLRLAVTDRCNLRCAYCMPEKGIQYFPNYYLLTFEEIQRICSLFADHGISKIRITGGEPFLRKDMMFLMRALFKIEKLQEIHLTTNGTLVIDNLKELKSLGLKSINLSLDSLNKKRFTEITRRDNLDIVLKTLNRMLDLGFKVKINMVVMNGRNTEDILSMVALGKEKNISIRFIEEMPFNGSTNKLQLPIWNHVQILEKIYSKYPNFRKLEDPKYSTSMNYQIDGFIGTFGIIAAFSRTFCGSCNRIRLTPQGTLKTCLYDNGVFNIRDLMRAGASDKELMTALSSALSSRAKNGHEAEAQRGLIFESMATIGG